VVDLNNLGTGLDGDYSAPVSGGSPPVYIEGSGGGSAPPPPGKYQATGDSVRLAEDNQSGSVYVQPSATNTVDNNNEDLYLIFYQPEGDSSSSSEVNFQEPLYYQNSASEIQEIYAAQEAQSGGASTSSFSINVKGQDHGYSHSTDHAER